VNDLVPSLFAVIILGGPQLFIGNARHRAAMGLAVVIHTVAALSMVWVVRDYYGYGDMLAYWRGGVRLAAAASGNGDVWGDILLLALQQPNSLSVIGNGWSTGSMHAFSAILCFLFSDSLPAICIAISLAGLAARRWLFESLVSVFPGLDSRLFVACIFVPSVVFWTAGLLKEAIAMPGLAIASGVSVRWLGRRLTAPSAAMLALPGWVLIGLTKPYILFPLTGAIAAGWVWARSPNGARRLPQRLTRLSVSLAVAVILFVALGNVFPRYSIANIADSTEDLRQLGITHAGGSTITPVGGSGSGGLLLLAPVGVLTTLFRPFFFEAKSALMVMSALEMSVFGVLVLRALARGPRRAVLLVSRSWIAIFCFVFVALFAVAVGVSTVNLGTLSRYRVPMMPLYAVMLAVLVSERGRQRHGAGRGDAGVVHKGARGVAAHASPAPRPDGLREDGGPAELRGRFARHRVDGGAHGRRVALPRGVSSEYESRRWRSR